jgi:hypothetical protein
MSGEAPAANETTDTIVAANAPVPRPGLKDLPVRCSMQNYLALLFRVEEKAAVRSAALKFE